MNWQIGSITNNSVSIVDEKGHFVAGVLGLENAHKMVAAPELLKSLQAVLKRGASDQTFIEAVAAIKKAEGL